MRHKLKWIIIHSLRAKAKIPRRHGSLVPVLSNEARRQKPYSKLKSHPGQMVRGRCQQRGSIIALKTMARVYLCLQKYQRDVDHSVVTLLDPGKHLHKHKWKTYQLSILDGVPSFQLAGKWTFWGQDLGYLRLLVGRIIVQPPGEPPESPI